MTMRCAFDSFLFRGTRFSRHQAHYCLHRHKFPHSHQVVSRRREDEDPVHARRAAVAQLAQQADRLQPTEDLFDPFALLLADLIAGMARRASIDGRLAVGVVLGHVWRHLQVAQLLHEVMSVVFLVAAQRDSSSAADLFGKGRARLALGRARRRRDTSGDRQAVAILHQQVAGVAQLCLFAFAFATQHCFRIGSRLMRFVRAFLAVKVHCRITRIIRGRFVLLILRLETFQTGRCFQQGAVNCEVLVAKQFVPPRLVQHAGKELLGDVSAQQPLTILCEGGRVPHAVVHVQAHEPAKEHVVVQFFHQQPFTAHAVEHLQQQRSQQLLRRDRRPPLPRVKLIELRRQLYKHCIRNLTYRSQWMLLWHSLLWREVTEHSRLLQIVSAHLVSFSFVASLYYSLLLRWTMRKSYFFSSLLVESTTYGRVSKEERRLCENLHVAPIISQH